MKLKGIEMQGFKSFADRTKLTFDDGITAIVGPNGSGKSNISDAVKWVFGEQSVKSLRGAKMEDVIFGGTHTRKPMGFAWVSLYIDNTDRSLEVDSDEVIITRKLYRSGESEYKINGDPIRLKDLHEIFMDTGLGRDGYSIIEQGKIADIVSAKSQQRREIFEEAAGISKFRYRKTEAERRLEQAEGNLVRLRDILGEMENRVGPLRIQAEKAKQFQVLAGEKKTLELSLWLEKLDQLRLKMKEMEDKLLVATSDRSAADARVEEIETGLDELHRRSQELGVYIENKRGRIKEYEELINSAALNTAVKNNDIQHNQTAIEGLRRELEAGSDTTKGFDAQIAAMQSDLEERRDGITEQERSIDELRARAELCRAAAAEQTNRMEALAAQDEEVRGSIARARVSGDTSTTLIAETISRLDMIKAQTRDKDENLQRLRQEYSQSRAFAEELKERLEGLENTVNGCRMKLSGRQESVDKLSAQQRALEKQAGERLQKAQLLSDMEKNMEGFNQSVRAVMKQAASGALRGIVGPVSSLITVEQKHSTAIEIAMGAALQNVVTVDESSAKRAIELLKSSQTGRATFMPVTNIRGNVINEPKLSGCSGYIGIASELVGCDGKYKNIIDYILGRTIVAEELNAAAAIAKEFGHRYRVVSLDGQVVNAGGSLTGGYVGKSGNLLSRRAEIEQLTAEAREINERAAALEQQMAESGKDISSVNAILEGAQAEAKTAGEDFIVAGAECKRLAMSIEEAEKLSESALREIDELSARMAELKDKELSSGQLITELTANLESIAAELIAARAARDEAARSADSGAAELSELQIAFAGMCKDFQASVVRLEDIRAQKLDSAAHIGELDTRIAELEKANEEINAEIERINLEAGSGRETIDILKGDIEKARAESDECERRTNALRQQEKTALTQREIAGSEIARLGEQLSAVTAESDGISSKMWEEYEVTKTEAAALAIALEDSSAAQKRLNELKNKIRSLGTVNLAAIEEYAEVSERYTFYRTQIEDAEKSKAELIKMIGELAADMSNIFESKFVKINEHFGRIFSDLFGGGTGRLTLTDPDQPLETGIDIFVQPPGKIVKNISALSGGEQAFVAICIYFAILKVSPAPFVLIDEIEAALDEVNVSKFASYLRQMTDRTQFIAVTHRRGTMDEADVLYGVTMEQEGVSKVLKLNIAEMGEKFKLN